MPVFNAYKKKKCDETVKIGDEQARGVGHPAEFTTEDTESTEEIASRYKNLPRLFADSNLLPNLIFYSVLSVSSVVK
jgi:hypothetical protein